MKGIDPIAFRVPALPVARPRQRHRLQPSKAGKSFIKSYTPADDPVHAFKASVRRAAHIAFSGSPLSGPLRVDIEFVFPRTKSQIWKRRPMPRIPHAKKPDRDNLDKAVLDALNGLLWVDDAQVCDGRLTKWIAAGDEQPHVSITISRVQPVV